MGTYSGMLEGWGKKIGRARTRGLLFNVINGLWQRVSKPPPTREQGTEIESSIGFRKIINEKKIVGDADKTHDKIDSVSLFFPRFPQKKLKFSNIADNSRESSKWLL